MLLCSRVSATHYQKIPYSPILLASPYSYTHPRKYYLLHLVDSGPHLLFS